ncbi:MAG: YbhB/YbcL family Raf kinase inhibitor-like protein [Microbacteriaceae bacterium]|nr:YbhB/YbcL family Raf kinase inhibitor-like protein [Microbacteriaceae bacterium]
MTLERPVSPNPYDLLPAVPSFTVTSTDVTDGQPLKDDQVADLGNTSPQLSWEGAPEGTKSYTVTCFDPDAPTPSGFWHWVLVDVPADVTSLDTGAAAGTLPGSAFHVRNDGGFPGFMGAAPPVGTGRTHRYHIAATALDVGALDLPAGASLALVHWVASGHTLGRAVIVGTAASPAA